jgi:hypothetical protein
VIGNGQGWHLIFLGPDNEIGDSDGAIKERIVGMEVEMNKLSVSHGRSFI